MIIFHLLYFAAIGNWRDIRRVKDGKKRLWNNRLSGFYLPKYDFFIHHSHHLKKDSLAKDTGNASMNTLCK
jgi:hypothetical protein